MMRRCFSNLMAREVLSPKALDVGTQNDDVGRRIQGASSVLTRVGLERPRVESTFAVRVRREPGQ